MDMTVAPTALNKVQRGVIEITPGDPVQTVTLTEAVNLERSVLHLSQASGYSYTIDGLRAASAGGLVVGAGLTDGSTIEFTAPQTADGMLGTEGHKPCKVYWQVIEYL